MTLHSYLIRRFFATFLQIVLGAVVLMYISDLAETLRRYQSSPLSFAQAMHLAALILPGTILAVLPFLIVLTAALNFYRLSSKSEMIAIRALGFSAKEALIGPALVTLSISLFATFIWYPIAVFGQESYYKYRFSYIGIASGKLMIDGQDLWIRQQMEDGSIYINARAISQSPDKLNDLHFYKYSGNGDPQYQVVAEEARIVGKTWILYDTKRWIFGENNPESSAIESKIYVLKLGISADDFRKDFSDATSVGFLELRALIHELRKNGLSTSLLEMRFWSELAMPLFLLAMLFAGATFMMAPARLANLGAMALKMILFSFSLFFLNNLITVFGINETLPILLAAFAAPLIGLMLSLFLLLHLEDG